jgi:hypothetical protein
VCPHDERPLSEVVEGGFNESVSEVGRRKGCIGTETAVLLLQELVDEGRVFALHDTAELEVIMDAFNEVQAGTATDIACGRGR